MSSVPRMRFVSVNFRIVAFVLPNCKQMFWQGCQLLRYTYTALSTAAMAAAKVPKVTGREAQPPWSQSVLEALSTAAPFETLSISSAIGVSSVATTVIIGEKEVSVV